ncbi:Pre-mRNA-splicing factor of RES complex-domain-containing protein [Piptocephalis cylindrospora]|uniref:Pre-mRNA-splicing factor of RES complex-domain-containing protein n=1 Tax=Piptocephalis cylindrospora TaxID=1907219 RepID=A0A4P9XY86_9FUNG|nr:Pre-mRNA-splicing factor of RES complex-domain-containing protein [Piptocephalis cylindrospora]|eukprot:RKP11314.1 Pre-mRNA-splicing factor of RES complex-domain-containing protein [Piptocephalis cylindrospora]
MSSGAKAGLQTGREVAKTLRERQEEQRRRFEQMDHRVSGRGAQTVHRDRRGRRVDEAEEQASEAEKRRKEDEAAMREMEWGKGRVQRREEEERRKRAREERDRPFARYADDPEVNRALKERMRWDDPAARYHLGEEGGRTKGKARKTMPVYKGPAPPPNRFGIRPGYRWDGVDRSNGFEKKLLENRVSREARSKEAHRLNMGDL